jgi:hypothetical protein
VSSIIERAKELHAYVMAAPAAAAAIADTYGGDMESAVKLGALSATLSQVEFHLRHMIEDLSGERMAMPPAGWELGKREGLELLAAAEVAPHEDTSIAEVG